MVLPKQSPKRSIKVPVVELIGLIKVVHKIRYGGIEAQLAYDECRRKLWDLGFTVGEMKEALG